MVQYMKNKIKECYEIPKDPDNPDILLERNLTVYGKTYTGQIVRTAYEDTGTIYKIPLAYGINNYGISGVSDLSKCPKVDWKGFDLQYRHNQESVIEKVINSLRKNRTALFTADTGFGKTVTALKVATEFKTKVVVLVNTMELVYQWQAAVKEWTGEDAGIVQGDNQEWQDNKIVIATIQTLSSRIKSLPKKFWESFGMVVCDECHLLPCDTFQNVIVKFPAKYRVGMSATLRRKDGMGRFWNLHLGPVVAEGHKSTSKLTPQLETPVVNVGIKDGHFYDYKGDISHTKAVTKIAENLEYNRWIVKRILKVVESGRNLIVTTHRKKQLEILEDLLKAENIDVGIFCAGKHRGKTVKKEHLDEAITKQVVLATYGKIGLGLDFPQYDTILLATPTADSEQAVGRVGRDENGRDPLIIHPIINTGYCRALFNKCKRTVYVPKGYKIPLWKYILLFFGI